MTWREMGSGRRHSADASADRTRDHTMQMRVGDDRVDAFGRLEMVQNTNLSRLDVEDVRETSRIGSCTE
jgi:hypothetical protein